MSRTMARPLAAEGLDVAHRMLRRDQTIDIRVGCPEHLLEAHDHAEVGVDSLVGVLESALRLPPSLTVRVTVSGQGGIPVSQIEAFRNHCEGQANNAWREAMTLRQGGFRALPRALMLSVSAAVVGVAAGYLAQGTESTLLMVLLYAVGFMSVIAAWTIGWAPIEQAAFDWRAPGHTAAVYTLLAQARFEVVGGPQESG